MISVISDRCVSAAACRDKRQEEVRSKKNHRTLKKHKINQTVTLLSSRLVQMRGRNLLRPQCLCGHIQFLLLSVLISGKYAECSSCHASCKTCFGPQALDCSTCFKGSTFSSLLNISVWLTETDCSNSAPSKATSWTRRVPVWRSVRLVPMETPRPTCARNVRPTVNPAAGTAITASAAPKVATNCISTRGAAGPTVQSKKSEYFGIRNTLLIPKGKFYLYQGLSQTIRN